MLSLISMLNVVFRVIYTHIPIYSAIYLMYKTLSNACTQLEIYVTRKNKIQVNNRPVVNVKW